MTEQTVAFLVLGGAVIVLSAVILCGLWLHLDAAREWRAERADLLNRVFADTPRELVALQKASRPRPDVPEPAEPDHLQIGTF